MQREVAKRVVWAIETIDRKTLSYRN